MWFQPNHQIKFTIFVTFSLITMIFLIFNIDRITNVIRCRERVIFLKKEKKSKRIIFSFFYKHLPLSLSVVYIHLRSTST